MDVTINTSQATHIGLGITSDSSGEFAHSTKAIVKRLREVLHVEPSSWDFFVGELRKALKESNAKEKVEVRIFTKDRPIDMTFDDIRPIVCYNGPSKVVTVRKKIE